MHNSIIALLLTDKKVGLSRSLWVRDGNRGELAFHYILVFGRSLTILNVGQS